MYLATSDQVSTVDSSSLVHLFVSSLGIPGVLLALPRATSLYWWVCGAGRPTRQTHSRHLSLGVALGELSAVYALSEGVGVLVEYAFEAESNTANSPCPVVREGSVGTDPRGVLGFCRQLVTDGVRGEEMFALGYAGPNHDGRGLPLAVAQFHPAGVVAA